jgi:hypothetical protein
VTDDPPFGRCPVRGCPFRWRSGGDRRCADHSDAGSAAMTAALDVRRSMYAEVLRGAPERKDRP